MVSVFSDDPSLWLGNQLLGCRLRTGRDRRSRDWLGSSRGTEGRILPFTPSRPHPGSHGVLFSYPCSGGPGIMPGCHEAAECHGHRVRLRAVTSPQMPSAAQKGNGGVRGGGSGGRQKLGGHFTFSTPDCKPNIISHHYKKKKENLYKPR